MAKIFLHLGSAKTATTFIQRNLVASRKGLMRQNCTVIWLRRDLPKIDSAFRKLRGADSAGEGHVKAVNRFFAKLRANPRDVFFTSEVPVGTLNLSVTNGVFYPNIAANMERFKIGLAGREITVGYAVRNLADFIESSYMYLVGRGHAFSFQEYLSTINTDELSWLPVIEELAIAFGAENLRIWKYEDFKKSPLPSYAKILEAAGLDASKLPSAAPQPANVSIPRQTLPIALEWNRLCAHVKKKKPLLKAMRDVLAKSPPADGGSPLLSDDMRKELTARYERDMDAIYAKWPTCKLTLC